MDYLVEMIILIGVLVAVSFVHAQHALDCFSLFSGRYMVIHDDRGFPHMIDLSRPLPPSTAVNSDITLHFYSRSNPSNGEDLPLDLTRVISSTNYDSDRLNVFIVHGWVNDHFSEVNTAIREAFVSVADVNVFVVDWSGPAGGLYTRAVANVARIGSLLGNFIQEMQDVMGLEAENFLLIGYSLGAHVCGIAGSTVHGNIATIVSLDAAGPLYWFTDNSNRLDSTDAQFVHAIHTNDGTLGFSGSLGTVDIRPNGGSRQPGCGFDFAGICSHSRSYLYYAESIVSGGFTARSCDNFNNFLRGACTGNRLSSLGGLHVDRNATGEYYLVTNNRPPFSVN